MKTLLAKTDIHVTLALAKRGTKTRPAEKAKTLVIKAGSLFRTPNTADEAFYLKVKSAVEAGSVDADSEITDIAKMLKESAPAEAVQAKPTTLGSV